MHLADGRGIFISLRPRELCLGSRLVKSNPNCTGKLTRADELGKVSLIEYLRIYVYLISSFGYPEDLVDCYILINLRSSVGHLDHLS